MSFTVGQYVEIINGKYSGAQVIVIAVDPLFVEFTKDMSSSACCCCAVKAGTYHRIPPERLQAIPPLRLLAGAAE